jgi:predicted RNase H-like nuclease
MSKQDYILTYTKTKFYPLAPIMEDIHIEDIAHSLSQMARANGHFKNFYSVAQHSINCCKEAEARGYSERVQLGCLLHDASEAYLADITRPVKKYLSEYLVFEEKLQRGIYERFNIGDVTEEDLVKIKEVDDAMLFYEFRELMEEDIFQEIPFIKMAHDFSKRDYEEVEREFVRLAARLSGEEQDYIYVGIDGCKGGWAAAAISKEQLELKVYNSLEEIMNRYGSSKSILIDMPIGLKESSLQIRPEEEARKLLKGRASCIFNVPCRQAVYAEDYNKANELNKEILGKGISKQSYGISSKIREVDEFLIKHPQFNNKLLEAHPEVCFAKLNYKASFKEPVYESKKTDEGRKKRVEILKKYYNKLEDLEELISSNKNLSKAADDIIDALCLAVSAMVGQNNRFETIPERPEKDSEGRFMQMIYGVVEE